ncbi:YbaK/EbsC family protein [Brevibacillus fluminis]|uniref:YbaK/EbsC family protein n=1 Tax=Brevibacillus fluminis TaxID=511487 RepID=A0A3M8DPG0_9BACL|nr:YbaK/EbsC family protein [Brevibacillus fluminis]RNB90020.1 YbaK/EbsC family protein [Brevibacillus fluminis]
MITANRFEDVRLFVKQHDEKLEPILLPEKVPTSEAAARVLGVEVGQIAKSILFRAEDKFGLFVAAGDVRVDQKKVKQLLGGKKPRIASPEDVVEITGFQVGAVCPFALRTDIPIFIDESLRRFPVVYTAAGVVESMLPITFDELVAVTKGMVVQATAGERAEA